MKELPSLYEIWIYSKSDKGGYNVIDDMKWWDCIKEIDSEILHADSHWHYFYERYYLIVRCQKRFIGKVHKFLDEKNIEYGDVGKWIDDSFVVLNYKEIFQPLFHSFTKLAILGYTDMDRGKIVDRVIHCFMNHQFYNFEDVRNAQGYYTWEAHTLAANAVNRALHQGRVWQDDFLARAKLSESEKEEKKDGNGESSSGGSDGG
jgi:hypothetical protein